MPPDTPELEVRANFGTPEQLPEGGAQTANQGYAEARQAQAESTQTPTQPQTSQPETPAQGEPTQTVQNPLLVPRPRQGPVHLPNEEEHLLFGPTNRPLESLHTGVLPNGKTPLPENINEVLPHLITAAQDPDAPPQLRGLVALLIHFQQQL